MADNIKLVVSGKTYSDIRKDQLEESSGYFRALFSGRYGDSRQTTLKFNGWSTKAFEVLLEYMTTGDVDLKAKNAEVLRMALEIAEYLVVDEFKSQLIRTLVTSWSDLPEDALELADELGVRRSLEEYSLITVLNHVEKQDEQSRMRLRINFDVLILVTNMKCFWNFVIDDEDQVPDRWERAFQRYKEVLQIAMKLPPQTDKVRALAQNLQLHFFDETKRTIILDTLCPSSPFTKLLTSEIENCLADARQNIRRALSHIRLPFETGYTKVKTFGIAEFNMNSWSWVVKECKGKFTSTHCVVKRDYATFLGHTGLFIIQMQKREPTLIQNVSLGAVMNKYPPEHFTICINGKYIFILDWVGEATPKLYKFNFYTKEFSECVEVPLSQIMLKGHGDILYIVGYGHSELCVMEYKVKNNELSYIVRSTGIQLNLQAVLVQKRNIYLLAVDSYTIVDTVKKQDQTLVVKDYVGFVHDMWYFMSFLDAAFDDQGILLLLYVTWGGVQMDIMVARLNLQTDEISCLCIIPKVLNEDHLPDKFETLYTQMETRRARDGVPPDNEDILKLLKRIHE